MRAWTVSYSALAEQPSRTISGEVLVTSETIETATRRALVLIRQREGRSGRAAKLDSITLRIKRGGTVDRATADHINAGREQKPGPRRGRSMTRRRVTVTSSDPVRSAEWERIFGSAVLSVRSPARQHATAPSGPASRDQMVGHFYVLDEKAYDAAVLRRVAGWAAAKWGHPVEQVLDDIHGEHGLPIIDRGDLAVAVDARLLA